MKNNWIWAILKLNWANMVSNRTAFITMTSFMCLQNLLYFGLWVIVFSRISSLKGWGLSEVAFLYSSGALGYGVLFTILGGMNKLGHTIQDGALDTYLSRPRSPLVLALMERMRPDSLGDVLTGIIMIGLFVRPPIESLPLIFILSLSAGIVFASVRLITHTLAFWGVNGDASENMFIAFLIAGTNPQKGFGPYMKLALLTIFPAGYIALLPVEIIRHFRWDYFAAQLGGSLLVFGFALWLFHHGLKHYASGNKFLVLR